MAMTYIILFMIVISILTYYVYREYVFSFHFHGRKKFYVQISHFLPIQLKFMHDNYGNMIHLAAIFRTPEIPGITNRQKYISTKSRNQNVQK